MNKCANINSPFFKALAKELNISSFVLEPKVSRWMNENNEDRIPTLTEMKAFLEPKAIPLKGNEDLYKRFDLLNKEGDIKIVYERDKEWVKSLNRSTDYDFKLRKTSKGNQIFIYNKPEISTQEELFQVSPNQVNYNLKTISLINNNLDKVRRWYKEVQSPPIFWEKLQRDLGIPKEQIELLKNSEGKTIEEKLIDFVANYSYTVEINTAKNLPQGKDYSSYTTPEGVQYVKVSENDYRKRTLDSGFEKINKKEFEDNQGTNTQYYSNLTVAGGTNYTENGISTPAITPSIKGHAQFSTENGIGWFRSDIKETNVKKISASHPFYSSEATKTRRILEVQSDLFQKGRNKDDLTKDTNVPSDLFEDIYIESQTQGWTKEQFEKEKTKLIEEYGLKTKVKSDNQFLQLLNKDNNWVTFFVKSIVQDSAKKGYEKVLFPSGNTASKVEGHSTLEEFKKQKEDRIKELERRLENKKDELSTSKNLLESDKRILQREIEKIPTEINQLKQELERVETEGFGALRGVYNFYENVIKNILKKNYTINEISDEYGNTWNEIEIKPEYKNNILLQKTSQGIPDKQLDSLIKDTLKKLGVNLNFLDTITDNEGNPITDIAARASYTQNGLKKIIDVVKGKMGLDTLTEEATHIMVWMLRGTPLYNSMMNDIHKFPEYKQVLIDYKDKYTTDLQFKEEAVAKLITQRVIQLNNSDITAEQYYRANSWFKRVLSWFKTKIDKYFEDPYNKAAAKMLFGDVSGLSNDNIKNKSEEAYQTEENPKRQEAVNKIKEVADKIRSREIVMDNNHKYSENGFNYANSVTEEANKLMGNRAFDKTSRTELESIKDEFGRLFGSDGHDDLQNAFVRAIEKKQGIEKTPKVMKLDEKSYDKIETFAKEVINSYPIEAQFFIEQPLGDKEYNKGKGVAGTSDFFVIYVNENDEPSLDILDWKFVNYKRDGNKVVDTEINARKKEENQKQVVLYRDILKRVYGADFKGKTRLMPISANIISQFDEHKKFLGYKRGTIEVAELEYNGTKLYLNPIPLETESTGNETVDTIVKNLINQRTSIEATGATTKVEEANQNRRISKLNELIKETILTADIKSFLLDANAHIDSYNTDKLDAKHIIFASKELLPFYKNLNTTFYEDNLTEEQYKEITPLIDAFKRKVSRLDAFIESKLKDTVIDIANGVEVEDINEPQADISIWQKFEKQLSQQNHPKLKALYKLIIQAKDKVIKDHKEIHEKIKTATDKVIKYAESKGISATTAFVLMVVRDKYGNLKRISKFNKRIWEEIKEAKATRDVSKIKKYFDFDKEAYEEGLKENMEYWKESYKYAEPKSRIEALDRKRKEFEAFNNAEKSVNAYFGKFNPYLKLKEDSQYYSDEYKHIQNTPALKEFYDLFNDTIEETSEWLDAEIDGHFIPQIPMGYIDQIAKTGFASFSKMKDIFVNSITAKQQGLYGEVNPNTGELYKSIPVYYTNKIGESASDDLGKVLSLWVEMAYNNKHLQEVESSINILYEALKEDEYIQTNIFGKPKMIDGKEVVSKALDSRTLSAFMDYMNEAVYGINVSHKDVVYEKEVTKIVKDEEGNDVEEKSTIPISGMKAFSKLITLTSSKAMALNFIGSGANLSGNVANGFYEGVKGIYYDKKSFVKSIGLMASGNVNPKTQTIMRYFDIMDDMEVQNKADALSVNKANHFFTQDRAFSLYKAGDHLAMNGILMSMLQTHGINTETNKVEHLRNLSEGTKSIYDSAEIVDGKLQIKGMTDVESEKMYRDFRRKVFAIGERITGLAPTYDIRLINQFFLGKASTTFRNWIPRMLDERTGKLSYNSNLEAYEEGKHRTTFNFLAQKGLVENATLLLGYSIGIGSLDNKLKAKYLTLSEKEKSKMSEQDYIALQKGNIRSSLMEIQTILAIFSLLFALKPGDDRDRKEMGSLRKYSVKMLDKLFNEVSFFVNPASAESIIGSPIPATRTLKDVWLLGKNLGGEVIGEVIGDEEMQKKYKPIKYLTKQLPYTSQLGATWGVISDDKYWGN